MTALLILIPITLLFAALAVAIFFWAVGHAQFEDLDTPGSLPLLDEPPQPLAAPPTDHGASATESRPPP